MSYGDPSLENDIRARAAVLAEAILATNHHSDAYQQVRDEFRQQLAQVQLPPDEMTWFAVERVALRAGAKAVKLENHEDHVPGGALVVISSRLEAPENAQTSVVRSLQRACFVIAPASWGPVLREARLPGLAVHEDEAPARTVRSRGP